MPLSGGPVTSDVTQAMAVTTSARDEQHWGSIPRGGWQIIPEAVLVGAIGGHRRRQMTSDMITVTATTTANCRGHIESDCPFETV